MFEACLSSIFNSTLKDLEVIVVDDGSNKNYSSILNKFDVKYFKTKNQGTLEARIFGVKQCKNPYVCFVDSDDTVSFNYFEGSLSSIGDADIVLNDWAFHTKSSRYVCYNDSSINSEFVSRAPLKKYFSQRGKEHSTYVLWNKVFKREIILSACEKVEALKIEKMVYAEDVLLTYFAYKLSNKVVNTHLGFYYYRVHDSQQVSVDSKQKLINHVFSLTEVFNFMEKDLKEDEIFDNYKSDFMAWKQMLFSTHYAVAKKFKSKELNEFVISRYGNCKMQKVAFASDSAYMNQKVLPTNIKDIDKLLKEVYCSKKILKVFARKSSYAHKELIKMKKVLGLNFEFSDKKEADIVFPKETVSIKQKILHNTLVFKVGVLLFPKGSKIRAVLKSKL